MAPGPLICWISNNEMFLIRLGMGDVLFVTLEQFMDFQTSRLNLFWNLSRVSRKNFELLRFHVYLHFISVTNKFIFNVCTWDPCGIFLADN